MQSKCSSSTFLKNPVLGHFKTPFFGEKWTLQSVAGVMPTHPGTVFIQDSKGVPHHYILGEAVP